MQVHKCVAPSPRAADAAESSAVATKDASPAVMEGASHGGAADGRGGAEETAGDETTKVDGDDLASEAALSLDEV